MPRSVTSQAVLFLARGIGGGLAATEAFLQSYRVHPAGLAHDLIILAKAMIMPVMFAVFLFAIALRALIYYTVKREESFANAM